MAYVGYTKFTEAGGDGPVGRSGNAVSVYSVFINSGEFGATTVILRNGTSTAGTAVYTFVGAGAFALELFTLAGKSGVTFPDGCFMDMSGSNFFVTVTYQEVGS